MNDATLENKLSSLKDNIAKYKENKIDWNKLYEFDKYKYNIGIIVGSPDSSIHSTLSTIGNYVLKNGGSDNILDMNFIPVPMGESGNCGQIPQSELIDKCDAVIGLFNAGDTLTPIFRATATPCSAGTQYSKYDQGAKNILNIDDEYMIPTGGFMRASLSLGRPMLINTMRRIAGDNYEETDFFIKGGYGARSTQNFKATGLQILLAQSNVHNSKLFDYIDNVSRGSCIQPVLKFEREYRVFITYGGRSVIYEREIDTTEGRVLNGKLAPIDDSAENVSLLSKMRPLLTSIGKTMHEVKKWPFLSVDIGITDKGEVKMIEYSTESDFLLPEYVGVLWELVTDGMVRLGLDLTHGAEGVATTSPDIRIRNMNIREDAIKLLNKAVLAPRKDMHAEHRMRDK